MSSLPDRSEYPPLPEAFKATSAEDQLHAIRSLLALMPSRTDKAGRMAYMAYAIAYGLDDEARQDVWEQLVDVSTPGSLRQLSQSLEER